MLCKTGHAVIYIKKAAEFDEHGAGRQLLMRYDGFSKEHHRTLRKTIEQLRHINGTNIVKHIDLFEKICGQWLTTDPINHPLRNRKLTGSWIPSKSVRTNQYTHHALTHTLMGVSPLPGLSNCIRISASSATPISNCRKLTLRSTSAKIRTALTKGGEKAKANRMGQTTENDMEDETHREMDTIPKTKKDKGSPKEGKGKNNALGNRKFNEPCSYCNIPGHSARDCHRRQRDEKAKQKNAPKKSKEIKQHVLIADETDLMLNREWSMLTNVKRRRN
jgi:hypothetical protein